jgi:hypothetical protein
MKTKKIIRIFHIVIFGLWLTGFLIAGIIGIWTANQDLSRNIALTSLLLFGIHIMIAIATLKLTYDL